MDEFQIPISTPQAADFAMTDADVAEASRKATQIFREIVEAQPRPVMLFLASLFRRWDHNAKAIYDVKE